MLAEELGYSSVKALDNYMRRKNFSWDSRQGIFFPTMKKQASRRLEPVQDYSKAGSVATLYEEGCEPTEVAKKLGFQNHRDLTLYMSDKGYQWDCESGNYIRGECSEAERPRSPGSATVRQEPLSEPVPFPLPMSQESKQSTDLHSYLPILRLLQVNQDRLVELLESIPLDKAQIPQYAVPGTPVTKSVYMVNTIDKMVKDFSGEKNISQRQIFELALLEFFKKYGYGSEVEQLLRL